MSSDESPVTRLLKNPRLHTREQMEELFRAVEADLRDLAKAQMANERPGHTLQPTALIDDAFTRLVRDHRGAFANRRHFYAAAAEAMRRILIDHARARNAAKRGGGAR
ncbi:MAG: ECF-type sigma factor, partial [Phycisphaerales bacterium JB058]